MAPSVAAITLKPCGRHSSSKSQAQFRSDQTKSVVVCSKLLFKRLIFLTD